MNETVTQKTDDGTTVNTGANKSNDFKKKEEVNHSHKQRAGRRTRRPRKPRVRSEFENKILGIRRVTRVVAGGRRFSFSVTIVLGNGKGKVGVGLGKASDTAIAIEKATRDAKKNLITVDLTENSSIPHEVQSKYDASEVLLIPTPGKGFKAGSAVRTVLELAGVKDVSAKILSRSKNPLNNAQATIKALKGLNSVLIKKKGGNMDRRNKKTALGKTSTTKTNKKETK